ncbi:MAG: hypothetical protein V7K58_03960, partial [Nostoc sp.]
MRLSPVLLAAVAIAVPLGGSMSANAEAAKGSKQTTEVLTLETNQQPEKDTGQGYTSESLKSPPNPTGVTEAEHLQSPVVVVYPAKPAAMPAAGYAGATSEVIVPTSTTPRTGQTSQINPNPTQQPSPAPVIPPPASQQQTPSPTLETTPEPSTAPVISPPGSQQPTPPPTLETTPVPENTNPPTTEPLLPTTPEPSTAPVISPPGSQQQTPPPTLETTPVPENTNPPTTEPLLPTTPEPS